MSHLENNSIDIPQQALKNLADDLNNKFDDIITEGLKLKGFEFEKRAEIISFIKERCKVYEMQMTKIRVFHVDDIPFLEHHYKEGIEPIIQNKDGFSVYASLGKYKFL